MSAKKIFVCVILVFTFLSNLSPKDKRIKFDAKAYFWMAGLKSYIVSGAHTMRTQNRNVLGHLRPGASGALRVRWDKWFLFDDLGYLGTSNKLVDHIATVPEKVVDLHSRGTYFTNTFAGGVLWKKPIQGSFFLGLRYFFGRLKLTALPPAPASVTKRSENWPVPIVGAVINVPLYRKLTLDLPADIGFDKSYVNWQFTPVLSWKVSKACSADAGYRVMRVQHKGSNNTAKSTYNGICVGMRVRF